MKNHTFSWELFNAVPIIGIIRGLSRDKLEKALPLYYSSGFRNVEITMNTQGALPIIQWLNQEFGGKMNIGAGTVCTSDDFEKARKAGAQFIVTPILNTEVIRKCVEAEIPAFPGAFSPTEIYQAWNAGASMVKVFPATLGGLDYIKQIKGPLNTIKLLPTGGVTQDNLADFLKAGADGFGIGSEIFDKKLIMADQWQELEEKMKSFIATYQRFNTTS